MLEPLNTGWGASDTWTAVVGALSAMSCALLGVYMVLRKMSMMGDAISHAVLPGLAAAFLLTQSRGSLTMFIGAAVVGVLTAVFTEWIRSAGKVDEGASMGVVFTVLFALGLILMRQAADKVDLDPGCVLYGAIETVPLDTVSFAGLTIPRAVLTVGPVFLLDLLFVIVFYKELKISTFDPALATTVGVNDRLMHYLLMTLVAITTVAAFESVGSILVIAMLIVPAAAAYLLTDRLDFMLVISVFLAAVCAPLGHLAAIVTPGWFGFYSAGPHPVPLDTNTAGMMAVVAGLLFTASMLLAPRHGLLSKLVHRTALSLRIVREDVLGLLFRLEELGKTDAASSSRAFVRRAVGAGPLLTSLALRTLMREGRLARAAGAYRLTPDGRQAGASLVRSHRLWETFLSRHFALPIDHVHGSAERLEHVTDAGMRERLDADLGAPQEDPHGKPIPPLTPSSF